MKYIIGISAIIAAIILRDTKYFWPLMYLSLIPGFLDGFYHTIIKNK